MNSKTNAIKTMASAINKPPRMWIDGKCFNIKPFQRNTKIKKVDNITTTTAVEELSLESVTQCNYNISKNEQGVFFTSFRLPKFYYLKIYTFPDFTIKKFETETATKILIPKRGNEGNIIINGEDETNISNARNELHTIVSEIRDKSTAMQFISIPVHSDEVKENFKKFKNEIINGDPIKGMDETIFQKSLKLHLTVVVFALMDNFEQTEAINALNDYKKLILDPLIANTGPLKIQISGINCMNDNLSKVDVLYANAKFINETENNSLQTIVNGISDFFYERGLVMRYKDNVKLHVTLINTKYRKSSNEPSPVKKKRWVKRQPFDARPIIEKYKEYYFGECNFDTIHLSLISSTGDDGFYKPLSIIKVN